MKKLIFISLSIFLGFFHFSCSTNPSNSINNAISGCTDSTATNFDTLAIVDDGSCVYDVYGCIDSTAYNFNILANIDDSSCVYSIEIGDYLYGGVVFWIDSVNQRGLVCDINSGTAIWGCQQYGVGFDLPNHSIGDGIFNTIIILNECSYSDIAARYCANSNAQGYSDWFLPTIASLEEIYYNRSIIDSTMISNNGTGLFENSSYWSSDLAVYCQASGDYMNSVLNFEEGEVKCEEKNSGQSYIPVRLFNY